MERAAKTLHRMSPCTPVSVPVKITWKVQTFSVLIEQLVIRALLYSHNKRKLCENVRMSSEGSHIKGRFQENLTKYYHKISEKLSVMSS